MGKIYTIAFLAGLAVMGIELSASRLIAPYYGTSIFVWTNVIAVILAALSLGYFLGGRISESQPRLRTLLSIILAAGILTAIIPYLVRPVAVVVSLDPSMLGSAAAVIVIGSFFLTLLLFFLPIMLLGMTCPFLIKIVSLRREDMGNVSGRIFAISTIGSIIGTFLPALIFIPWIGTKLTILVFASILILIGLVGLLPRRFLIIIPLLALPFGTLNAHFRSSPAVVAETESAYQYIQVVDQADQRLLVYNEGHGIQSIYQADSVWTGGGYFDFIPLAPGLLSEKPLGVLVIGSAGGTIVRTMNALFGDGVEIEGLEIDRKVTEIAEQFFGFDTEKTKIHETDGRNFLRFSDKEYDVIVIDVYANQLYIPFHMATQEFFEMVRKHLTDGGVAVMNVNASFEDSKLLVTITNTLADVFPYVYRVYVPDTWNYIIFASPEELDFERLGSMVFDGFPEFTELARYIAGNTKLIPYDSKEKILTDDWAPLEHMTDSMIWQVVAGQVR